MARHKDSDSSSSGSESDSSKGHDKKPKKDKKDKDKKDKSKDKKDKKEKEKEKDKDKDKDKDKNKDKKDKGHKDKDKGNMDNKYYNTGGYNNSFDSSAHNAGTGVFKDPSIAIPESYVQSSYREGPIGSSAPPAYSAPPAASPPPSGYRIPLSTTSAFPDFQQLGQPPCFDADGVSPVFIGSALFETSVHPCKIGPHLSPPAAVPYGGVEHAHHGRYDLLPFNPQQMEWVPTSYGRIPPGRHPIEGGYEENGNKLYHALAVVNGVRVPGKTGEHLGSCNVSFGGSEHIVRENYEILCWR